MSIKNFDKLVELNKTGKSNDRLATTNGSTYCDMSMSKFRASDIPRKYIHICVHDST
jgi:hypothetical protein